MPMKFAGIFGLVMSDILVRIESVTPYCISQINQDNAYTAIICINLWFLRAEMEHLAEIRYFKNWNY